MTMPALPRNIFPIAKRILAAALIVLLLPIQGVRAQEPAAQTPNIRVSAPLTLHINILDGEGALNNIRERTAREPIVQVEDENHKPVAGVAIIFSMLDGPNGAGGSFNSLTSFRTVTDAQGKAVGKGFQPNSTTGQFSIQVAATLGTVMAAVIVIHQTNSLNGGAGAGETITPGVATTTTAATSTATTTGRGVFHFFHIIPKWVVVGVVAGAAAGVAIGVTQTNNGATISAGGTTVGAPASNPAGTRR